MGGQGLFTSLPSKYKNYNLGESLLDGPEHVPLLGQDVLHVEEHENTLTLVESLLDGPEHVPLLGQ